MGFRRTKVSRTYDFCSTTTTRNEAWNEGRGEPLYELGHLNLCRKCMLEHSQKKHKYAKYH